MENQNLNPEAKSYDQIVHFLKAQIHAAVKKQLEQQAREHEAKLARMEINVELLRGFLLGAESTVGELEEDNKELREANKRVERYLAELAKVAHGLDEESFDFQMARMANHTAQVIAAGSYDDIGSLDASHRLMSDLITELDQEVSEDQKAEERIDNMMRRCQKLMDEPSQLGTDVDGQGQPLADG